MMEINQSIKERAEALYDPALAYHNVEHVEYVLAAAERLIDKCRAESVAIDADVVAYALLFHDAGYIEDHRAKGYDSKEAYSADIAADVLSSFDFKPEFIAAVKQSILATHMDAHCQSNEDILVRAADLSGLADSYKVFRTNSEHLKQEFELLNERKITWAEWKKMVARTLELFLREDLKLTSDYYDDNGDSVFHKLTRQNIEKFMQDDELKP